MTSTEGPLTWAYTPECTASSLGISDEEFAQAIAIAVEFMWAQSARRYGTRAVIYRPQTYIAGMAPWGLTWLQPMNFPLYGYNNGCYNQDSGPELRQIVELDPPVVSIESVLIAGVSVDQALWRQENNYLVRQDGLDWPRTQNMIAPLGAADTWSVQYTRGLPVSPYGQLATGKLICYLGTQIKNGGPCAVPYNTSRVTRGGVTVERDTKNAQKVTGVTEVDRWLAMVNPNNLQQEPVIWSPDVPRHRKPFAGSYASSATGAAPVGVPNADVLVLGPTDPVPAGTPVGTVILRSE